MKLRAMLVGGAATISALLGASPAAAHQSPPGCASNSVILTPTKDKTLVRNGDQTNYTVSISNDVGAACDVTGATVTLTLPAPDGTPTGQSVTLAAGANYPAGSTTQVLGTVPYTVAMNPGVTDAVVRATVNGTLHDAPTDHAADVIKTLGTEVTQPHLTLTESATPASGQAPLSVTFTYTLTNDSSTPAPISNPRVTDDKCDSVTLTGGDGNGNGVLDNGETWTYTCTQRFVTGAIYTSSATATGTSTVDNRPVDAAPVRTTIEVANRRRASVLRQQLPPVSSERARGNAPCVSTPRGLRVRARELTVVRVRVRDDGQRVENALVRITGPGLVLRRVTNENGLATFRVRPRRSGRLVIQSDRCTGADRLRVLTAREVSGRGVPRVTG
jgi:hypothetical protein